VHWRSVRLLTAVRILSGLHCAPPQIRQSELVLSYPMRKLETSQRHASRPECLETQRAATATFDRSMILLNDIVHVTVGAHLD
jgi:hypothetical protein